MRRLILVLLMLAVPVQAALAAMCSYCEHRANGAASHALAHGESVAKAVDVDRDGSADDATGGECALCHIGSATLVSPVVEMPASKLPIAPPMHKASLYDPSHLDRIERVPLVAADSI